MTKATPRDASHITNLDDGGAVIAAWHNLDAEEIAPKRLRI